MSAKIKDLPVFERPRERLINNGVANLSNEELLAILLKTGKKGESAKSLANNILVSLNNFEKLRTVNIQELMKTSGVGLAKASNIIVAIELGKRLNCNISTINNKKFDSPDVIFEYYQNKFRDNKQECFYAIYLDASKKIISDKLLFIGTVNKSLVHPRNIFKEAYLLDASAIICIHNHPSNNVLPSKEDIMLTDNLVAIAKIFNIPIIDHIIIGITKYYSFFENGHLN